MKNLLHKYSNLSHFVLGAILITLSLIASGFLHFPFLEYFPFGLFLVICATWFMYRLENKNLDALGFNLKCRNLVLLIVGLALGILSFLLNFYVGTLVKGGDIIINSSIDFKSMAKQFLFVFPTAAVQDFIIVGYCFYKLIEMTNKVVATILFGLFFISLHDFWNGNMVEIFFYSSCLFIGFLMFSVASLRSKSILLPIGIHWGNNFANSHIFTFQKTDTSLLYIINQQQVNLSVWQAIGLFISMNIGAILVIIGLLYWRNKNKIIE